MDYFTVISSQEQYVQQIEEFLSKLDKDVIITKEFGKMGNHPHYNLIFRKSKYSRTDKLTDYVKRNLKKKGVPITGNLVKTTKVITIESCLRYITKEHGFVWINYPDNIKDTVERIMKIRQSEVGKAFQWKEVCNLVNFTPIAVYFVKNNYSQDYKYQEFVTINQLFKDMTMAKIKCSHLMRRWKELDFELGLMLVSDTEYNVINVNEK
jgi:hypothetical protein